MELKESFSYQNADVESVFGLISDQTFRTESCANQGATDYEVSVDKSGDGATVTLLRTQETDMPDFVKKLTGKTVKVKQTEVWSAPDGDGNRTAKVKVSIIGQPAEMVGTAELKGSSGGTALALVLSVMWLALVAWVIWRLVVAQRVLNSERPDVP